MAEVRLSEAAAASLEAQDHWLRPRNPRAADRFLAEIRRTVALLADHPLAGRPVKGRPARLLVTRRFRFRILGSLSGGSVLILDVLHPRQSGP